MLAIRMQRTGRKGYAQFRVILQDSHRSPSTGKVIAYLGSYDPHTKEAVLKKDEIEKYLSSGAQPSNRVAILLKKEGVKLPKWATIDTSGSKKIKDAEKLRKNQPKETKKEASAKEDKKVVKEAEGAAVEEELIEEITEEVAEKVVEEEAEKIVEEEKVEKSDKAEKAEKKKEEEKEKEEKKKANRKSMQ